MGAMPITCARETDPPHCKSSHARALHQLPDFLDVDVPNHDTALVNKRRWSVTELSDDDGLVLETPANQFGWFVLSVGVHNPQGVWGKLYYFEYDDHGSIACGDAREVVAR